MKTLDPVTHVRDNPAMYLRGGRRDAVELARQLAGDAIYLGAKRAQILEVNGWLLVAADIDWMKDRDVRETFQQIVPFTEAGVNSMRSEILLTAYADDVFTADETGHMV